MKSKCPYCGAYLDLEEVFREGDLNAVIRMLPVFGQHHKLVWEYVELFGIAPIGRHAGKIRRLLTEMEHLWNDGEFYLARQRYVISTAGIVEALRMCVNRGDLEPRNHNYLKAIMKNVSERERTERSKQAERELRKQETRLMAGEVIENPDYEMPLEVQEKIRQISQGKFKS